MIPGIDPKIDIAFKKVFGSDTSRDLTKALINAVLEPTPWQQLEDLELLNPYSDKMTLDDSRMESSCMRMLYRDLWTSRRSVGRWRC